MTETANYIKSLNALYGKKGTEQTYRTPLENYLRKLLGKLECEIQQEPGLQRDPEAIKRIGAPDFIVTRKDEKLVGYVETKPLGENLDDIERKDQLTRYREGFLNLVLTDYLEFRFFREGEKRATIRIGEVKNGNIIADTKNCKELERLFEENFCTYAGYRPASAEDLAKWMARKARLMRGTLAQTMQQKQSSNLHEELEALRQILIHDMSVAQFVDVYAQTIIYGLFVARYHAKGTGDFSPATARQLVPHSQRFLRHLFDYISGEQLDKEIHWAMADLCDIYVHADLQTIFRNFQRRKGGDDPIIHFYETFLGEYDAKLRKGRGVYFTPEPVVQFIVRAVDFCLKKHFSLPRGLAAREKITRKDKTTREDREHHRVQILDAAAGTGSFLVQTVRHIRDEYFASDMGSWDSYVREHLQPRLHGFELLMAPYAMCHLRLDLLLDEPDYRARLTEEKGFLVYLANALEAAHEEAPPLPYTRWLAQEANQASKIKSDSPIMVVIGNPPYSGISQNMNLQKPMIDIEPYKRINGKPFRERKHWLNDDYVKFIRLAEYYIAKNGEGIMGYITNHAWLSNPTFRGMRQHMLATFDDIYILDLHGSTNPREYPPGGVKDENVFDIQKGVAITIAVKRKRQSRKKFAQVHHMDVWGRREEKYKFLAGAALDRQKFSLLPNKPPYYFFVPKDFAGEEEYEKGVSVREVFLETSTGITTARDRLVVACDQNTLIKQIKHFTDFNVEDKKMREHYFGKKGDGKYPKGDSRGWQLTQARKNIAAQKHADFVKPIAYRPFDERCIYYDKKMVDWPRTNIMQHFWLGENWGLQISKQQKSSDFHHIFVHKEIAESCLISNRTSEIGYSSPLYRYDKIGAPRAHNFALAIVRRFEEAIGRPFLADHKGKKPGDRSRFSPLDILDYIYAVLHSPTYRKKYKEFLKIDFPRVPLPRDAKQFWAFAALGGALRQWHLLAHPDCEQKAHAIEYPQSGTDAIEKVSYRAGEEKGSVLINSQGQRFTPVPPHVWEFYIGGYQPAQKWLKDRKGQQLSYDQMEHYKAILAALDATHALMEKIDKV